MVSNVSVRNRVQMFERNPTPRSSSEPAQVDHPFNRTKNRGRNSNVSSTVSSTFSRPDDASVNSESECSSEIPAPRKVDKNVALDWPMEDEPVVKALTSPLRRKPQPAFSAGQKNVDMIQQRGVHKAESPASRAEKSPFKLIMNHELKTSEVAHESDLAVQKETREVTWPSPKKEADHRDDEPVVDDLPEPFSSNDEENEVPVMSCQPEAETANPRSRTTRAQRLIRTKHVVPKTRNAELKVSLDAASVVMDEEKSNAGSSNASSRSSLSNHELGNIAHRALTLAKSKETQRSSAPPESAKPSVSNISGLGTPIRISRASKLAQTLRRGTASTKPVSEPTKTPETIDGPGGFGMASQHPARCSKNDDVVSDCGSVTSEHSRSSLSKVRPGLVTAVRRTRTVTNVTHQQARKALLNAAQKKKEKSAAESHEEALARLGSRASRVVALKFSTKMLLSKPETVQVVEEQAVIHPEAKEKTTIAPGQVDRQSRPAQKREQHFDDACSVVSAASVDSKASRRSQHPAFAARSPLASRGGRKNSFSESYRENRYVSELEHESSKARSSSTGKDHFKIGTGDRRDPDNGVNPSGMSFGEESRHQTRDAASPRASRNGGREHGASTSSISQSRSYDVHPAEHSSPSTLRDALAAGHRRSLSQPKSLNQAVDLMESDLAPAGSEHDSAKSKPIGSFLGMGQSPYASKQPFNDNYSSSSSSHTFSLSTVESQQSIRSESQCGMQLPTIVSKESFKNFLGSRRAELSLPDPEPSASQDSSLEKQRSGLPSRGLKLSAIPSRDSFGGPPEVFENPESSSPGRSVRSFRSMRSVSPPGRGPIFPTEFDYLTKKPSKQSGVDADPIKITVSTPKDRSKTSIPTELDQGQSSRDHATRVNRNFDDIEPKQSWKASSPPDFVLSTVDSDDVDEDQVKVSHPKEGYSLPEDLFEGGTESDSDFEDVSFRAESKLDNLKAEAAFQNRDGTSEKGNRDSRKRRAIKYKNKSHSGTADYVSTKDTSLRIDNSQYTESTVSSGVDSSSKFKLNGGHSKLDRGNEPNEDQTKHVGTTEHVKTTDIEEIPTNDRSVIPDSLFGSLVEITTTGTSSTESKLISLTVDTGRNENHPSSTSRKAPKTPDATAKKVEEEKPQQTPTTTKSESSRWWKSKKGGMKMANVIKQAFSKPSPRKEPRTPSEQFEENPFSNDEDDIFCGLEDDNITKLMAEVDELNWEGDNTASKPLIRPSGLEQLVVGATPESATVFSNDRSGTELHQSQIQPVNSDITSSLLAGGGPGTWAAAFMGKMGNAPEADSSKETKSSTEDKPDDKIPATEENSSGGPETSDSAMIKSVSAIKSSTKAKVSNKSKSDVKSLKPPKPPTKKDGDKAETKEATDEGSIDNSVLGSGAPPSSMFMKFGCGIVDSFTTDVTTGVCRSDMFGTAKKPSFEDGTDKSDISRTSSANNASQMTDLEHRVWTDWDRRDSTPAKDGNTDANYVETNTKKETHDKKQEAHDKKRIAARDKLAGYGSSAISSQMSVSKGLFGGSSEYTDDDSSTSRSESEFDTTTRDSKSYYSATTDMFSEVEGSTVVSASEGPTVLAVEVERIFPTTPILLSFGQRSLVEKFTKQLGTDGVEVLKLNSRKQWQVRYFTVAKEQLALTAHEAKSKSGDTAQCPKALLWLKKFNNKNGGYGLTNIDKSGHGGMMIVDLTDVSVSNKRDLENPLPKKLQNKFQHSVLVTLDYTVNGTFRSVEFRCKNNDEAQFLCTCLRVIRDLLRREQFLRLRSPAFFHSDTEAPQV